MFKAVKDFITKYKQATDISLNVAYNTIEVQRKKIAELESTLNECYEKMDDMGERYDKW